MDHPEHEDSPGNADVEITDLDLPGRSSLTTTFWRYSYRHRRRVWVFKIIFMGVGVLVLAIAILPLWLAPLSRQSSPARSAPAPTSSTKSTACSASSSIVLVIASSGQSTGGSINAPSTGAWTVTVSSSGNLQSGHCPQLMGARPPPGGDGGPHQHDVRVRIINLLSGGGIQWYSMR